MTRPTWPLRPVSEVCELAVDCVNKTAPSVDYETTFKMIRTTNVKRGFVETDDVKYVTEEVFTKWTRRSLPMPGDVILTREAPLGEVGRFRSEDQVMLGQRLFHYRANQSRIHPEFLAYVLQSPEVQGRIRSKGFGATVEHARVGDCENLLIPVPDDLELQAWIGESLAAFDDHIENNRRRIKLLEEVARLIYREWFVRLRFPGHELTKIEDGIPEGWSERPIEGALESHIGGGWGQDDPLEQEIEPAYVIRGTDFPAIAQGEFGKVGLRYHKPGPLTKRILSAGDIIFEVSGGSATQPIARTVYMTDRLISAFNAPIICASFCKKFRPLSPELGLYLHLTFKEDRENGKLLIYQKQSASALLNFNFEAFLSGYRVRVPSESVLNEFYKAVFPLLDQCTVLAMQNKKLSQARDLLLPRLMSGEIAL